ncbi:MAG: hypothetical protein MPL62_02940 [Alphaproteobacteria bacterium]|nr:hypothetical protein [Alphaproteobacteria bacterium]
MRGQGQCLATFGSRETSRRAKLKSRGAVSRAPGTCDQNQQAMLKQ